jgi:hypothetical protein
VKLEDNSSMSRVEVQTVDINEGSGYRENLIQLAKAYFSHRFY